MKTVVFVIRHFSFLCVLLPRDNPLTGYFRNPAEQSWPASKNRGVQEVTYGMLWLNKNGVCPFILWLVEPRV